VRVWLVSLAGLVGAAAAESAIGDDGTGFDPETAAQKGGFGLRGMQESASRFWVACSQFHRIRVKVRRSRPACRSRRTGGSSND
jgi:glucose-6-phosphate-specific signal transduction histidine kinase